VLAELKNRIKGERVLTLSHWRYRLLHWFFKTNPTTVEQSPLPKAFYTHYCPLFWFSTLILLISPFVWIFRKSGDLVRWAGPFFEKVADWLITHCWPKTPLPTQEDQVKLEAKEKERHLRRSMIEYILAGDSFKSFWTVVGKHFSQEPKVWGQEWNAIRDSVLSAAAEKKALEEKRKQQMIFWVNFTRTGVRGFLKIVYFLVAVGVFYFTVFYVAPLLIAVAGCIWEALTELYSVNWWSVLKWGMGALISSSVLAGILVPTWIYFSNRWQQRKTMTQEYQRGPGFLRRKVRALGRKVNGFLVLGATLIETIYEDNCPPVKIVDPDLEQIFSDILGPEASS